MDSAVAGALSHCNMEVFTAAYAQLHPHIMALATHKHSTAYAAIGLGCFAEVSEARGSLVLFVAVFLIQEGVTLGIVRLRPHSPRVRAWLGIQVFREMKDAAVVYAESPQLLNAVARGISQDDDEDYRRNACFCLSVIYEVRYHGVGGCAAVLLCKWREAILVM